MIEWLKRLWLEEYEVTIWFNKEKLNPFADEKVRSKKVFFMKKIQTKKQTHFRGIDIDNNQIEIRTTEPFDYQIKKIY
tara:strand:- start:4755 stop:4988 length:234 start_codon:yes stop_codon:yes gene_type:complete